MTDDRQSDAGGQRRIVDPAAETDARGPSEPRLETMSVSGGYAIKGGFQSVATFAQTARSGFREAMEVIDVLRAPFFVSLIGALAFALPGQTIEIFKLYGEDFEPDRWQALANVRFACFIVMLYLTGLTLWYIARVLTILNQQIVSRMTAGSSAGWTARWMPRLIGAAPAAAAAIGMLRASEFEDQVLMIASGLAALIAAHRVWAAWRRTRGRRERYEARDRTWFRGYRRGFLTFLLLAGVGYLMTFPIAFTQTFGTPSLVCFFMIALAFGWSHLTYVYDRFAIPALSLLIGAALVFSMMDLNDNHEIRLLPALAAAKKTDERAPEDAATRGGQRGGERGAAADSETPVAAVEALAAPEALQIGVAETAAAEVAVQTEAAALAGEQDALYDTLKRAQSTDDGDADSMLDAIDEAPEILDAAPTDAGEARGETLDAGANTAESRVDATRPAAGDTDDAGAGSGVDATAAGEPGDEDPALGASASDPEVAADAPAGGDGDLGAAGDATATDADRARAEADAAREAARAERRARRKARRARFRGGPSSQQRNVAVAFAKWLRNRQDLNDFPADKPYPVYLVAAQGGGLYAAYQTAMFLAQMQDECPRFAQHVFSVSAVSGGAVGAAVYAGLAREYAKNLPATRATRCGAIVDRNAPRLTEKVDEILSRDFLSPLISAMLFPDFSARFAPLPIPAFSRARALEYTLENAWADALPDVENAMQQGLLSYWSPRGAAPLLMLNTTEVNTGRRFILSPVCNLGPNLPSYMRFVATPRDPARAVSNWCAWQDVTYPDVRLSTAAVLSARFPIVTPAGSLTVNDPRARESVKARLVDGGYFENSGIDTALDLRETLREVIENERFQKRFNRKIDLRLIVLDLTEDRYRPPSYSLNELMSPVRALLNSRASRAELAQSRVRIERGPLGSAARCRYLRLGGVRRISSEDKANCPPGELAKARVWSVSLNDLEFDFQLGWVLSRRTLTQIQGQISSPTLCPLARSRAVGFSGGLNVAYGPTLERRNENDDAVAIHNSCIGMMIGRQLEQLPLVPGFQEEEDPASGLF